MTVYLQYAGLLVLLFGTGAVAHRRGCSWQTALALCLLPAAAMIWFLWNHCDPQPQRFGDFRKAFEPAVQVVGSLREDPRSGPVFVNIPIVALLFSPLLPVGGEIAQWVVLALGVCVVIAAAVLLGRIARLGPWGYLILAGLTVSSGPLFNSLREGNSTHLLLLALVLVMTLHQAGKERSAAVISACCGWIKHPLFMLGFLHLFPRRRKTLLVYGAAVLGTLAVSVLLFGWSRNANWFYVCIRPSLVNPLGAYNVQSVNGFYARLVFGARHLWDWEPIKVGVLFKLVSTFTSMGILGRTLWALRTPVRETTPERRHWALCLLVITGILISSLSWTHYFLFMLMPAAMMLGETWRHAMDRRGMIVFWCGVLLCLLPLHWFEMPAGWLGEIGARLFLSHTFIGGLLVWDSLLRLRAATGFQGG